MTEMFLACTAIGNDRLAEKAITKTLKGIHKSGMPEEEVELPLKPDNALLREEEEEDVYVLHVLNCLCENLNSCISKLYIVFTVHLIITGRVHFYTNLCTQLYSIISLFSPIRISAYLKTPSSGGVTKFTSIDYTILVYVVTSIYIKYKMQYIKY
jgi:hypothetical protein